MIKLREEPKKFISNTILHKVVHKLLPTEEELISYVSNCTNGYIIDAKKIFSSPVNCLFGIYEMGKDTRRYLISLCLVCGQDFSHGRDTVDTARREHIFSKHERSNDYTLGFRGGAIKLNEVVACSSSGAPILDEVGNKAPDYIQDLMFYRENVFHCSLCANIYGVVPVDDIIVSHLLICSRVKNDSKKWDEFHWIEIIE